MVSGVGGQIAYPTFDVRRSTDKRKAIASLRSAAKGETGKQQLAIGSWTDPPRRVSLLLLATGNWKLATGDSCWRRATGVFSCGPLVAGSWLPSPRPPPIGMGGGEE